jgi:para-aminobenzoate synthetase/4-amino-4-deoxychorismate lyase
MQPAVTALPTVYVKSKKDLPEVVLSDKSVNSLMPWLYHKTTNRELYDVEYSRASENGFADVLFTNEHGHLTEGCISNVIIQRGDQFFTPPIGDGLLAGVMRNALLNESPDRIQEKSFGIAELTEADAVYICNSVRGLVQVNFTSR